MSLKKTPNHGDVQLIFFLRFLVRCLEKLPNNIIPNGRLTVIYNGIIRKKKHTKKSKFFLSLTKNTAPTSFFSLQRAMVKPSCQDCLLSPRVCFFEFHFFYFCLVISTIKVDSLTGHDPQITSNRYHPTHDVKKAKKPRILNTLRFHRVCSRFVNLTEKGARGVVFVVSCFFSSGVAEVL